MYAQVKAADSVGDRFVVEGNPFDSVRVKNAGVEAAAAGGLYGCVASSQRTFGVN